MDDATYNAIVERAIVTKRVSAIPGFGSGLAVDISRRYPKVATITNALADGSFSFKGVGQGRMLKLLEEFAPEVHQQKVAALQLGAFMKLHKRIAKTA